MSAEIRCCPPFNVLERDNTLKTAIALLKNNFCATKSREGLLTYEYLKQCSFKYTTTDSVLGSLLLTMALLHLLVKLLHSMAVV